MTIWPDLKLDRAIIPNPDNDWEAVFSHVTAAVAGEGAISCFP